MVESEYLEGANYILCECDVCRLIFQGDIPNDGLMERIYEHWIDPHKVFCQHEEQDDLAYYSQYAQEIMQVMAYLGRTPASLSFFDFGMGWGKWALMAKAFGCDSYGAELSLDRVEYARTNGIKVLDWDEIPRHQFDFINTEQVFEHIPHPLEALRHLRKALKPDGILKISVPSAHGMERRLRTMDWKAPKGSRNSLNPVAPLEHINCYQSMSLRKMASEAKMEEVFIPIRLQYGHGTNWCSPKRMAVNLLQPIYRNWLKRSNCVFLRNRARGTD